MWQVPFLLVLASAAILLVGLRGCNVAPDPFPRVSSPHPVEQGSAGKTEAILGEAASVPRRVGVSECVFEVVDEADNPVADAACLQLRSDDQRWIEDGIAIAASDVSGRIALSADREGQSMCILARGFLPRVTRAKEGTTRIRIARGGSLVVSVRDEINEPVPGVLVEISRRVLPTMDLSNCAEGEGVGSPETALHKRLTGANGVSEFHGLCAGLQHIRACKFGWILCDMVPPVASVPGEVGMRMMPLYAMGLVVRGGRCLGIETGELPGQLVMSGECDQAERKLAHGCGASWIKVFPLPGQALAEAERVSLLAHVLIEDRGWVSVEMHARSVSNFEPDILDVSAIPQTRSGVLRVHSEVGIEMHPYLLRVPTVTLVPKNIEQSNGNRAYSAAITLSTNAEVRIPPGDYAVEPHKDVSHLISVSPKEISVSEQEAVDVSVHCLGGFVELCLSLEDSGGLPYPSGFYRLHPRRNGAKTQSAVVFEGWKDARVYVPPGEYDILVQGLDGARAEDSISISEEDLARRTISVALRVR